MLARAVRRPHRVVSVLVLSILKAAIAAGLTLNTDSSATAVTDFTQSVTDHSEQATGLLERLTTSSAELTSERTELFTETFSDLHSAFTKSQVVTATDQRQSSFSTDTESWTSHNILDVSTELLSSSDKLSTTTTVTEWGDPSTVSNITVAYLDLSRERQPATDARTMRDLTGIKVTEQDVTDMKTTESFSHTDSTYISTTISRAGERTLLSITSNSTSPYTEDSSSDSGPNTFTSEIGRTEVTQGRDFTEGALSTEADRTAVTSDNQLSTNATQDGASESEEPHVSQSTQSQTAESSVTGTDFEVTPDIISHNSTSSFTVVSNSEGETDTTATVGSSTSRSSYTDTSMLSVSSSVPPLLVSSEDSSTNVSYHDSQTLTTETPTSSVNTVVDTKPDGPQTHMDVTTIPNLTTALFHVTPTVDDSLDKFLSGKRPFIPQTHHPRHPAPTEVVSTAADPATQRPQYTEEDTYVTSAVATATLGSTSISTSTAALLTTHQLQPSTTTNLPTPHITLSTMETTQVLTTPTPEQHPPYSRTSTLPQSPSSSQPGDIATDVSTLHLETSTATPGNTTAHGRHTTASYSKSTPNRSTVEVTTGKRTDRGPTQTEASTTQMPVKSTLTPGYMCGPQTCVNGGKCVLTVDHGYRCQCLPAWTGASCTEDVDECVSSPCPQDSVCVNTRGSFSCECALGYDLEDGRSCTQAKTFLGTFSVNSSVVHHRNTGLHELHKEILQLLNASLSILHGYRRSSLKNGEGLRVSAVNMFSMFANVTSSEVYNSIQMSLRNCTKPHTHCTLKLHYQLTYHVESLCLAQKNRCDIQSSVCNDAHGTPYCQCQEGFFKKNSEDTTCRDCGDGFELVNGTCVKCTFGFGGFNCNNFYGLIAKVVSPAAGGLLLIVIIALIVTCCRKDKNDINKIIFKSGDLQMSPYAEFPKSSRVSMEWGRETIEMQENGSTKNLLQMTDIYYSPALRNADLERNGLYPFSGLPGSRHSCIYPAQWNPSFISDDSRRRDYF